mmetsp:Transcript_75403/g.157176  ORF Transcript_75403/g.157176 Transcript_75403/m.157176 type:complete len:206 (+) Transcript_75403:364-981(+)
MRGALCADSLHAIFRSSSLPFFRIVPVNCCESPMLQVAFPQLHPLLSRLKFGASLCRSNDLGCEGLRIIGVGLFEQVAGFCSITGQLARIFCTSCHQAGVLGLSRPSGVDVSVSRIERKFNIYLLPETVVVDLHVPLQEVLVVGFEGPQAGIFFAILHFARQRCCHWGGPEGLRQPQGTTIHNAVDRVSSSSEGSLYEAGFLIKA